MTSAKDARRIIERFLAEAVTAGDSAAMDELVAEDNLKAGVAWIKEAFPDHAVIPEKLLAAADDHVGAVLRASGTHHGALSGVRFDGQSMTGQPGRSAAEMDTIPATGKRWEVYTTRSTRSITDGSPPTGLCGTGSPSLSSLGHASFWLEPEQAIGSSPKRTRRL